MLRRVILVFLLGTACALVGLAGSALPVAGTYSLTECKSMEAIEFPEKNEILRRRGTTHHAPRIPRVADEHTHL